MRVSDASGDVVGRERSRDLHPRFRMRLGPGAYVVRTFRRPCEASCEALDRPRDRCGSSVEMSEGSNRLLVVKVTRDGRCHVSDKGDVLEVKPRSPVADLASFTAALQEAGHEVRLQPGDRWLQRFFRIPDRVVKIDGREVHLFEYASVAERKKISITPDGTGISWRRGLSVIIEWSGPHFYRSDRLLVLFLGDDAVVLETLNLLLGPQFAGR
jgi:hypothetical protein